MKHFYILKKKYSYNLQKLSELKTKILTEIGIPVSIGVGRTKTLAKLANHVAKNPQKFKIRFDTGIFYINYKNSDKIFQISPFEEVWGIGKRYKIKLNSLGIYTISDFLKLDISLVRQNMGIPGVKTHSELKGIICFKKNSEFANKKSVTFSQSFGNKISKYSDLVDALTYFTEKASLIR